MPVAGGEPTPSQIIAVLKEHKAGAKTFDVARTHEISEATLYNWKAKYGKGADKNSLVVEHNTLSFNVVMVKSRRAIAARRIQRENSRALRAGSLANDAKILHRRLK